MTAQPTSEFQKILANDGVTDDMFGNSMAIFGDIAVIGAPQNDNSASNSGAAYVYELQNHTWTFVQKLVAPDGEEADMFGESVDIDSNYIVVSAYQAVGVGANTGAAYVFVDNSGTWEFQQKIYADDGESADNFGKSVAISGDYIVVGADNEDFGSGSAYVFKLNDTSWTQVAKLEGDDSLNDYFAHSVDIDGDFIAVGAWQSNSPESNMGGVFVFQNNAGTWQFVTKLVADDAQIDDALGYSVAISGNTIVAGAHGCDNNKGAAYVFVFDGTDWSQQAKLQASDAGYDDYFGKNVSISGDYVIAGAQRNDIAKSDEGAAYLFVRTGNNWTQTTKLTASDADDTGLFGYYTAIDGEFAMISTVQEKGKVYAFAPATFDVKNVDNYLRIYPNPVDDFLNIETNEKNHEISIFDASGKYLINSKLDDNLRIDLSSLPSGIYTLQIKGVGSVKTVKLVKK